MPLSFNRTIVELKRVSVDEFGDECFSFNRTIVELKPILASVACG